VDRWISERVDGGTGGREDGRTTGRQDKKVTHVRPHIRAPPSNHHLPPLHRQRHHTRRKGRDDLIRSGAEAVDQPGTDDRGDDLAGEVGAGDPAGASASVSEGGEGGEQ
jgi:hypothetical protein